MTETNIAEKSVDSSQILKKNLAEEEPIEEQLTRQTAVDAKNAKQIWMPDAAGRYCAVPEDYVAKAWVAAGAASDAAGAMKIIREKCAVEQVWKCLMVPPGRYAIAGEPVLVRTDLPFWVESEATEFKTQAEAAESIRENAYEQALKSIFGANTIRIYMWIAGARARIKSWRQSLNVGRALPALAVVGDQGTGKTLFASKILPRLLGAPGIDIGRYLTGATDFSGHIEATPLLVCDDTTGALSPGQRRKLGIRLKSMQFGGGQEIHLKGRDPITLKMPWAPVICCNADVNSLRAVPVMASGDEHKLLIVPAAGRLPANKTLAERAVWDRRLNDPAEIQSFVNVIDLFAAMMDQLRGHPAIDASGRQYVAGGCPDAGIAARLADISPDGVVADALQETVEAITHGSDQKALNELKERIVLRRLCHLIQENTTMETRRALNSQLQTHAERREAVRNYLEALQTKSEWSKKHRDYAFHGVFWKFSEGTN